MRLKIRLLEGRQLVLKILRGARHRAPFFLLALVSVSAIASFQNCAPGFRVLSIPMISSESTPTSGVGWPTFKAVEVQDCTIDSQTIADGASAVAYRKAQVFDSESCQPQARTCSKGSLSGDNSFQFINCTSLPPRDCDYQGQHLYDIVDGTHVGYRHYLYQRAPVGQTCLQNSQVDTCNDGVVNGMTVSDANGSHVIQQYVPYPFLNCEDAGRCTPGEQLICNNAGEVGHQTCQSNAQDVSACTAGLPIGLIWVDKADGSLAQFPGNSTDLSVDIAKLSAVGVQVQTAVKTLSASGPTLPFPSNGAQSLSAGVSPNLNPAPSIASGLQNSFVVAETSLATVQTLGFRKRTVAPISAQSCLGADAILAFGQSNSANSGQVADLQMDPNILMYYNGYCFPARDPLLGASIWNGGGSIWMPFAKSYLSQHPGKRIVIAAFGVGGSLIQDWTTSGVLSGRLKMVLGGTKASGLNVLEIFWHQGESDTLVGTSHDDYYHRLEDIFNTLQKFFPAAPLSVAVASYVSSLPLTLSREIQRAQLEFVAAKWPRTDIGVVSDLYSINYRSTNLSSDDIHFNQLGLQAVGTSWYLQSNLIPGIAQATNSRLAQRSFEALMLRQPSSGEGALWSSQLTQINVFTGTFSQWRVSKEAVIRQNYYQFAKRAPEVAGYNYWLNLANQGLTPSTLTAQFKNSVVNSLSGSYDHSLWDLDTSGNFLRPRIPIMHFDWSQGLWTTD